MSLTGQLYSSMNSDNPNPMGNDLFDRENIVVIVGEQEFDDESESDSDEDDEDEEEEEVSEEEIRSDEKIGSLNVILEDKEKERTDVGLLKQDKIPIDFVELIPDTTQTTKQ